MNVQYVVQCVNVAQCPRREWSPLERCDIDEAPQGVSFREKANQSNQDVEQPLSSPLERSVVPYPRWEHGQRALRRVDEARRVEARCAEINRTYAPHYH
jgi:hypothetical protein